MLAALTQGCETSENGNIPMIGVGLEDAYYIPRMQKLPLRSELTGENYEWELTTPAGETAVVSRSRSYIFLEAEEGEVSARSAHIWRRRGVYRLHYSECDA